jgi:hypothetical protein
MMNNVIELGKPKESEKLNYEWTKSLDALIKNNVTCSEDLINLLYFNNGPVDYQTALLLDFQTNEYIYIFKKSGAMAEILRRQNDRCDKEYGLDF